MRNSKTLAMLSIVVAATVLAIFVLSVSASENATPAEGDTASALCGRIRNRWRDSLDDDQRAQLRALIEENRGEVMAQLDAWGVEICDLDDDQRVQLRALIQENRGEVMAQLDAWDIEIPAFHGPMGQRGSLTEDQRDELRTMRQDFRDSVKAKLEEWGVDAPACQGGRGFRGRHPGGFGLFKP